MKTLSKIGLAMLVGYFLVLVLNGNKVAQIVKDQGQALVNVQTSCAQHTADANAVIDWASKR